MSYARDASTTSPKSICPYGLCSGHICPPRLGLECLGSSSAWILPRLAFNVRQCMLARGVIVTTRDKTSHAKHVISLHHPNVEKTWLSSGTVDCHATRDGNFPTGSGLIRGPILRGQGQVKFLPRGESRPRPSNWVGEGTGEAFYPWGFRGGILDFLI